MVRRLDAAGYASGMSTPLPAGTERVTLNLPADIAAALRKAGTKQRRNRTAQIVYYCEAGLIGDGFVLPEHVSPVSLR